MVKRDRTPSECIGYGLYLCFSGLSLRRVSGRLLCFAKRNHASAWNWIRKHRPQKIPSKRKKAAGFIMDETTIKAGSECVWLWAVIEPKGRAIPPITASKERNMFVAERFAAGLVKTHGKHAVSTDGGTLSASMWIPETEAPYPFIFGEKPDRKDNAVLQGQNRRFRWLFSMGDQTAV
jgi:putative transposase